MESKLFIGTSNVVLPIAKHAFPSEYKAMSRLGYYSTIFNTVEVNSTFYKLPLPKTLVRWSEETANGFKFTLKVWKEITHRKQLVFTIADVETFLNLSTMIADKQGCLLVQFPGSVTTDYFDSVVIMLETIQHYNQTLWDVVVEFRHDSWYHHRVYKMLHEHHACLVGHDKSGGLKRACEYNDAVCYLRFHGPQGDYRGSYSKEQLLPYSQLIKDLIKQNKTVYAYFNNTIGTAFEDTLLLRSMCS